MIRKKIGLILFMMITFATSGCAGQRHVWKPDSDISVISREAGSGTRGAFVELFDIQENTVNGIEDMITEEASITNNTAVALSSVSNDDYAIGYISLGSLNPSVKALMVDQVLPDAENIKNGTYKAVRTFQVVSKNTISAAAQDFLMFILSTDGQQIVAESDYIPVNGQGPYRSSALAGKVVVAGSSSVAPVMEKLKEGYISKNPNVQIEIQQSDSTTGINSAVDGICDLAMSSRALESEEQERGMVGRDIALDGIVIIVNHDNNVDNLTAMQVKNIFNGTFTTWKEVGGSDE